MWFCVHFFSIAPELCSKSVDTIQNYKKFILNGETFSISDVIRNRKEDLDDKKD